MVEPVGAEQKAAPTRKRWTAVLLATGMLLLGVGIGAGSVLGYQAYDKEPHTEVEVFTVAGDIRLTSSRGWETTTYGCTGSGGYDDISEGTSVVLKTAAGSIVGMTKLEEGYVSGGRCVFSWLMTEVPEGQRFYTVEIGHRGTLNYSRADLNESLSSSLGD